MKVVEESLSYNFGLYSLFELALVLEINLVKFSDNTKFHTLRFKLHWLGHFVATFTLLLTVFARLLFQHSAFKLFPIFTLQIALFCLLALL